MIHSLLIRNYKGDELNINLTDAEPSHGLLIERIEGLGPANAQLNMSDYATIDGAVFNSARLEKRIIDFTLRFAESISVEESRHITYKYFPIKQPITLIFTLDSRIARIEGYTQANTPDIFSPTEKTVVTVECEDPYFYEDGEGAITTTSFGTEKAAFEFPFLNEGEEPQIEFSIINRQGTQNIFYEGDAPAGIIMRIHVVEQGVGNIIISSELRQETFYINTSKIASIVGSALRSGDEIIISTKKRERYIHLLRNGVETNILNAVDLSLSEWFELYNGDNVFSYSVSGSTEDYVLFSIENQTIYEGV